MTFGMTFVYALSHFRDYQTQNDQNERSGGLEDSEFMFSETENLLPEVVASKSKYVTTPMVLIGRR
jgi:hypothetical protein